VRDGLEIWDEQDLAPVQLPAWLAGFKKYFCPPQYYFTSGRPDASLLLAGGGKVGRGNVGLLHGGLSLGNNVRVVRGDIVEFAGVGI